MANSTTAGFQIVFGMPAQQAALADAGLTVEQNWAALARRKLIERPCSTAADFTRRKILALSTLWPFFSRKSNFKHRAVGYLNALAVSLLLIRRCRSAGTSM